MPKFKFFLLTIELEILKLIKHKSFWFLVLTMVFLVSIFGIFSVSNIDNRKTEHILNQNPWYFLINFQYFQIVIHCLIYGFITNLHFKNDYENNMIKQYAFLPISAEMYFFSKIIALLISILCIQFLYFIVFSATSYYSGTHNFPNLNFENHNFTSIIPYLLLMILREFVSLLGYLSILCLFNYYIHRSIFSTVFVILLCLCNFSTISRVIPSGYAVQSNLLMNKHLSGYFDISLSLFKYEISSIAIFSLIMFLVYFLIKSNKNYNYKFS